MAKIYSTEDIAKIYGVSEIQIMKWSFSKFSEIKTEIPGLENTDIAKYLGKPIKSLRGKKKRQKKVKPPIDENLLEVKHFTWHDIIFHEKGYRINPNKVVYSSNIHGPTKILKNLDAGYFIENNKTPLFKVLVLKESGKVIEELSPDLDKISEAIRDHIETKITASGVHKKPISSNKEVNLRETESATRQYIDDHFSSNPYILWLSKIVLDKGHATALWENNNDTLEESILFVIKSNNYTYVIWENIHPARACYVFKYQGIKKGANKKVRMLINFINGTLINKRLSLFQNELNHELILGTINYYTLTHSDVESYGKRIYEVVPHLKDR